VIDIVVYRKRHVGIGAVHTGTAGIDQMLDLMVAATFEHIQKTDYIGFNIGMGILQRVTHTGLGGEIDHAIEFFCGKQGFHGRPVGHVHANEAKAGLTGQLRQTRFLEFDIVVVVEIVDADHFIPPCKQTLRGMHTNKPGAAGDQDFQFTSPFARP